MAVSPLAAPQKLVGPGFLFLAPFGTAVPAQTSAAGKFTDVIGTPYLALGATKDGSEFKYSTKVEAINVAEFFDPISYETVERAGSVSFNLASVTLTNYRRALNGGVAALAAAGTVGAEVTAFSPPDPGTEVRAVLLWESLDGSLRMHCPQVIQGGEVSLSYKKAPDYATIPCTFNFEVSGTNKPFTLYAAGTARV